jgi:hypothetical protein
MDKHCVCTVETVRKEVTAFSGIFKKIMEHNQPFVEGSVIISRSEITKSTRKNNKS